MERACSNASAQVFWMFTKDITEHKHMLYVWYICISYIILDVRLETCDSNTPTPTRTQIAPYAPTAQIFPEIARMCSLFTINTNMCMHYVYAEVDTAQRTLHKIQRIHRHKPRNPCHTCRNFAPCHLSVVRVKHSRYTLATGKHTHKHMHASPSDDTHRTLSNGRASVANAITRRLDHAHDQLTAHLKHSTTPMVVMYAPCIHVCFLRAVGAHTHVSLNIYVMLRERTRVFAARVSNRLKRIVTLHVVCMLFACRAVACRVVVQCLCIHIIGTRRGTISASPPLTALWSIQVRVDRSLRTPSLRAET